MAGPQTVWGIDVGRCALKALKLRMTADGNIEVVGAEYIEHAKILTQPDAERSELITAALEKFLSKNDISKDRIVVSVPGQHTLSRFSKLPPVAPKRIPDIVRYEADQQIPFDMDEVIWDYQTFQQEGVPDIEVGIFAMKRELIREQLMHFEQASVEPAAVQSSPLAAYNAIHFDDLLSDETTILLDIGAENTDLVIATKETLWTRTVPIGGNAFTEALVKSFKLSFSKAESLKRTASSSKYARQIFQAMRPVFADLVQELQRSIGFYSSTHREASIDKVIVVGNAFLLPGLQKYLQQNLSLPVVKPESFAKASVTGDMSSNEAINEQLLSLFTAYGLAIQGFDKGKVTCNLLPREIAKSVVWRNKRPTFAATAACIALAGGLIWFRQFTDVRALAVESTSNVPTQMDVEQASDIINSGASANMSDRDKAKTIQKAGDTLRRELDKLRGQGDNEREETEDLIQLMRNKTLITDIFGVIHGSVPIPTGPVGRATTQKEILSALSSDQTPRNKRNQVNITALDMHFEPDLKLFDWKSLVDMPEALNDYDFDTPGEVPGIKITITCTSPHEENVMFIRKQFMNVLLKNGRKLETGFYIDKVSLFKGNKIEIDSSKTGGSGRGGSFSSKGRSGRLWGGNRSSSKKTATPAKTKADPRTLDPVTHESIVDDWTYEIWVSVILEDLPEDALEEMETDDSED